jgi:gamma-butyrobetaine dioxygenase
MTVPVSDILELLEQKGGSAYYGEAVTQLKHALQAALAAEQAGAPAALVAAALVHDVGHLLAAEPADAAVDLAHEEVGARWLARWFGPDLTEPVRLHVPAKRYLCFADRHYRAGLSAASQASLQLQGGPLSAEQAQRFLAGPHAEAAVALRRWDEAAKVPGLPTPGLEHFRPYLQQALRPAAARD